MKFIQTIIAFFVIYLFVGSLSLLIIMGAWLSSYIPTVPRQQIANVVVDGMQYSGATFQYTPIKSTNALVALVARDVPQEQSSVSKEVLSARSTVLFATYTEISLSERLIPLGFAKMYRLEKVVTADGITVFERKSSWVDTVAELLVGKDIARGFQQASFIATEANQEYKVFTSYNGIEIVP